MLIYLLPPLGGLIYARAGDFSTLKKLIVGMVLALTFFYAFASGTRNVLGTYAISFAGAYFLTKPRLTLKKIIILGVPSLTAILLLTNYMLEFRKEGLSNFSAKDQQYTTLFIDHNIVNL